MKGEVLTKGLLVLMLIVTPLLSFNVEARNEQWLSDVPFSEQVELVFWMKDEVAYINVTIVFYSGGFEVRDWGDVNTDHREFWVDAKIWRWNGPTIQVIWELSHTYDLGRLKGGKYTFTFKAWGREVKSIDFIIRGWLRHGKIKILSL
jgi:hypothetical protein